MKRCANWGTTLAMVVSLGCLAGCGNSGPPKQVIKGKVSKGGEVMKVKEMVGRLRVWLVQQDSKQPDPIDAQVNFADGSFTVKGPDNRGIPAGKYKICVEWKDDFPFGKDKLNGQFDEAKSKIIRDLPGSGEVVIDVSKPEG